MASRPELERSGPKHGVDLKGQISAKVRGVLQALDRLAALELKDIQLSFPQIIAIGPESSGKSSVLERVAGLSLFPRGEGMCTRMPILLRLVHRSPAELQEVAAQAGTSYDPAEVTPFCRMSHREFGSHREIASSGWMALSRLGEQVKKFHDKFVAYSHGGHFRGISQNTLVLEIHSNRTTNLELLDLPGVVQASRPGEPEDICEQSLRLTEHYLQQKDTLVLGVVSATEGFRHSAAMGLVQRHRKQKETIGVLTKADRTRDSRSEARGDPFYDLKAKLDGRSPDMIHLHGVVATRNRDSRYDAHLSMADVEQRESQWFDDALPGYREQGKVGIEALTEHLTQMLLHHTVNNWADRTQRKLERALHETQTQLHETLGVAPPRDEQAAREMLIDFAHQAVQYWQNEGFLNPDRWLESGRLILPRWLLDAPNGRLQLLGAWIGFKRGVIRRWDALVQVFDEWNSIIKARWLGLFAEDSPCALRPRRFGNLQSVVEKAFPLEVSAEARADLKKRVGQLFTWHDAHPEERQQMGEKLRHLLAVVYFERVFFPAVGAAGMEDVAPMDWLMSHLRVHSATGLLVESEEWLDKRKAFVRKIETIRLAIQEIKRMVDEATRYDSEPEDPSYTWK